MSARTFALWLLCNLLLLEVDCQIPPAYYPISCIDWKKSSCNISNSFSTIFKEKNILILSEADHGDGSSYEAQCMILRELIDSSKINVIYTESSWIIIEKINEILKAEGINGIKKTIKSMHSVELRYWADNGFWNYLVNKIIEGKVELKGFDVGASKSIVSELFDEAINLRPVRAYIRATPKKNFEQIKFDYENFDGWNISSTFDKDGYGEEKQFIDSVIKGYELSHDLHRIKQWQSILDFFYWMYKRTLVLQGNKIANQIEGDRQLSSFMSVRDSLMAKYFLQSYSDNKKAVLLMSNYHAMRNSNWIEGIADCCKDPSVKTMTEILDSKLGKEIYNMCFITASGERGVNYYFSSKERRKIPKPKQKSLEYCLQDISSPYAVIDFKNSSLKDSFFYMGPVFYKYLKSNWSKNYSGVFFIKKMEPLVFKNSSVLLTKEELDNKD